MEYTFFPRVNEFLLTRSLDLVRYTFMHIMHSQTNFTGNSTKIRDSKSFDQTLILSIVQSFFFFFSILFYTKYRRILNH